MYEMETSTRIYKVATNNLKYIMEVSTRVHIVATNKLKYVMETHGNGRSRHIL